MFEVLCELATILEVTNVMLPVIATMVSDSPEICEIFLNSQLPDFLRDTMQTEFEFTEEAKGAAQFLIERADSAEEEAQ